METIAYLSVTLSIKCYVRDIQRYSNVHRISILHLHAKRCYIYKDFDITLVPHMESYILKMIFEHCHGFTFNKDHSLIMEWAVEDGGVK